MISKLQYITNAQSPEDILSEVRSVVDAGIDWVQLRIKNKGLDFPLIAKNVREICDNKAVLIINDRVDIVNEVNANGVHLGQKDMSPKEARNILGPDKIIGGTANTKLQCLNLELQTVDYIGLGPFAFTETKKELSPVLGLDGYREIVPKDPPYGWATTELSKPIVAIGGIKEVEVKMIVEETGVYGIACSGMIATAKDKKKLIENLKGELYGSVENWG